MKTTLTILDHCNVHFSDLAIHHTNKIIKKTKKMIKGAFHTAEYKMKLTDGRESQFNKNGHTYFYMLDQVLPMIEDFGYEVVIDDLREHIITPEHITKDYINHPIPELYYYQVDAINALIDNERGVFELPTSAGKGILAAVTIKLYQDQLDFVVIVPTEKLVKQVYADCVDVGLDIGLITGKMPKKKREEEWKHKHMVCTWQLIKNNKDRLERFGGFIYDELHVMGDIMFALLGNELSQCIVRLGMTGTVPKDKHKREKILTRIGGDVLIKIAPNKLQIEGYISTVDIEMYSFEHRFDNIDVSEWEWSDEDKYLLTNKLRLNAISEFIQKLSQETTMILCFKEFADNLKPLLNLDIITGDTPNEIREEYYNKLETEKNYTLIATYDTVGTGLSINEITKIVTIDMGKNETRIVQGIGRGLRKDGVEDHLKVIDIYSKICLYNRETHKWVDFSFSGRKHVTERKKIYNGLHYPFKEVDNLIVE